MTGLVVGNPEGFRSDSLFEMRTLEVDVHVRSLFSDVIVIDRILIEAPQITYEAGVRGTNLGALLKQLESKEDPETPPVRETAPAEPARQVVIKEFVLAEAQARVSATALGGHAVPIRLGTIRLTDLGGEGQSATQSATQVVRAVLGTVVHAVADAGDLLGDGLKAALSGAGALTGAAADGARAAAGATADGARAAAGMTADGAQAAADGARTATRTLGEGARRLRGLADRSSEDDEESGQNPED